MKTIYHFSSQLPAEWTACKNSFYHSFEHVARVSLWRALLVALIFVTSLSIANAQHSQEGKLVGTGAVGNAQRGWSVSLSSDGNTAIFGGYGDNSSAGAAWVFTRSGGVWTQQGAKLVGTGATGSPVFQGQSVSLSSDGNTAIVGGYYDNTGAGAAWIWTRSGVVWTQQGSKLVGTGSVGDAIQGNSVSLSSDGNTAIVGGRGDSTNAGAAWVFTRSGGVWTQEGTKLVGSGAVGYAQQGRSVSLSSDGNTAIVGGSADNGNAGAAWVFTRSAGVWTQQGTKLIGSGSGSGAASQGISVSLSSDGNTALVGGYGDNLGAGAVWVFTRSGGVWTQQGSKLVGTGAVGNALQGRSVSLSAGGDTAIVGGDGDNSNAGAAWMFIRSAGVWTQPGTKLVGTGAVGAAYQGTSVSLSSDGTTAIVGGYRDSSNAGAAWVFKSLPGPAFSINPGSLSFGSVLVSANKNDSVTVTNDGDQQLNITLAASDNASFSVLPTSGSLAPSASMKFYITFTPASVGSKSGSINFTHNGIGGSPTGVPVSGGGIGSIGTIPGYALQFDGVNQYVDLGSDPSTISGLSAITVEAWVKPGLFVDLSRILEKDDEWYLYQGPSDDFRWGIHGDGTNFASSGPLATNQWYHIAATYDPLLSFYRIFVNGELKGSQPYSTAIPNSTYRLTLAARRNGVSAATNFLNGSVDEVRIWSKARTADEIRQSMHSTLTGLENNLIGYWQLNEGSAITATDPINGNNGALTNSPSWVTSTIPAGGGTSALQTVSGTGSVSFSGTSLGMNFTAKSGSDTIVATMVNNNPGGTQPTGVSAFVPRYWTVEKFGSGTFTVNLTFTLPSGEISATDQANASNLKLFSRSSMSDGSWTQIASASSATATTLTFDGITSFSQFTIGSSSSPLPVQMSSFTATANGPVSELRWKTATETNNYGFEIERRAVSIQLSAGSWQKVGFVRGSGTSTSPREYSFQDKNLAAGRYAYRIKQIDNDGSSKYTGAVELEVGLAPREFTLSQNYPNPFNPSTSIEFTVPDDGKATLRIFDILGREVSTLFDGEIKAGYYQKATFDASKLSAGLYFARLQFGGKQLLQKMLLLK